ncbi:12889_t:CDS:2 [Entrophospora sp. SA101]|nr:12889_t:CDS:2 [Entrophospora sp. SA101]
MSATTNECKSFLAAEGQYTLKEDIIVDTGTPNLANGTLVSIVSVKYKDYNLSKQVMPLEDNNNILLNKDDDTFSFFGPVMKRKKQKNNITKTTSSFVAKIHQNDNLTKVLANRQNEDTYLFFNSGKTFCWSDLANKPKETLSRITFTKAHPICHDVNQLTRSCDHLDVIIGFSSGDGVINNSAVTMVKWMPGSESSFMASFHDGSIIIFDKERDDQTFAFSPDCHHVATVSVDGYLRIIDYIKEELSDTYPSYFGGFSCVCWSPDGKYVLTGGQDDLVTIWAFREHRIVARCQGHQSWVTGVSFDPWRCDESNYRFGSVGEDTKLLLWDFSVNTLHRPKGVKSIDSEPLCSITFREDSVITTCRKGHIKIWSRPSILSSSSS